MLVNCQMTVTTMIGPELGALMLGFAQSVTGEAVSADTVSFSPALQPLLLFTLSTAPFVIPLLAFNRFVRGTVGPVFITFALLMTLGPILVMDVLAVGLRGVDVRSLLGDSPLRILWPLSFITAGAIASAVLLWLVRRYRQMRLSDQTFLLDALWLSVSICVSVFLLGNEPAFSYLLGLAPFAAYKLVLWYGFRRFVVSDDVLTGARLLFLRVFGSARRSERLFDLLVARWRYAGPVQLISGTDIARSRFEPDEFLDFIVGRFKRRYIRSLADAAVRLAQVEAPPDPDGRYRVHEFFCHADIWQETVVTLMKESDLVAMDLRGFTAERQGCIFELGALVNNVPLERVVLLVDDSTDMPLLRQTLESVWASMAADSRNSSAAAGRVRILDLTVSYARAVRRLMRIGDENEISLAPSRGEQC